MKRWICFAVLLGILLGYDARADIGDRLRVVDCDEKIPLRRAPEDSADPIVCGTEDENGNNIWIEMWIPAGAYVDEIIWSQNDYVKVQWEGCPGYVSRRNLEAVEEYRGRAVEVTDSQRENINRFLSFFTEQSFMDYGYCYDDNEDWSEVLTHFTLGYYMDYPSNQLEQGEYYDYSNYRLPMDLIQPFVKKYFGVDIELIESMRGVDSRDGYYYWYNPGDYFHRGGFACAIRVEKLDSMRYAVLFNIYGEDTNWGEEVYGYTRIEAAEAYPTKECQSTLQAKAVIDTGTGDLDRAEDWHIVRYTVGADAAYY